MVAPVAKHSWRAFLTGNTHPDFTVITGSVLRNQFAYPYVQATVTIAMPSAEVMQILDPRRSVRVSLVAEKYYTDGNTNDRPTPPEQYKSLRLWLVSRSIDYASREVTLLLSGSELLVDDYKFMSTAPFKFGPQSLRSVVNQVLSRIGRSLVSGTTDTAQLTEVSEWTPGQSAWEFLTPLLEQTGRRLWVDETDNFRLSPRFDAPAGAVTLKLIEGESEITSVREAIEITDEYYDAQHVTYKWTGDDEDETEYTRYDTAQAYPKVRRVESIVYEDTRYPGPGAAQQRLKRSLTKGRKLDLSFVQDYTVNPGDSATILLNPDELSAGYIVATEWNWPSLEMTIATRDVVLVPAYAWINAPVGLAWNEAPAGTKWTTADTLFETEAD